MLRILSLCLALTLFLPPASQAQNEPDAAAIVEKVGQALTEIYVFPEVAEKMNARLAERLADGAYDGLDLPALTGRLTEDLHGVSHDLHIGVRPIPPRDLEGDQEIDEATRRARFIEDMRRTNHGFQKVEILPGNVGYLDLRGFIDAEIGGATAVAAMNFLAGADALIVDLRQNGGGSPSMIQLISSYFFAEPQHLNSFYIRREDTTQQFWTQAHVEGEKKVDMPIWVLTSGRTFSAAEEFTYNLKNMKRATIVGETTGGGAHPVDRAAFPELGVEMNVPYGRAVNPITGTNWEGTGVAPDVEVPAAQALTTAHRLALEKLAEEAGDEIRADLEWALTALRAAENPFTLEASRLPGYAGVYEPRRVWLEDGQLRYRRGDGPAATLVPLAEDLFALAEVGGFRIRFERDASGRVVTLVGLYEDGRVEPSPRTGDAP